MFGSNGHEKADYSRGVLERFTQRVKTIPPSEALVKTVANPRKIYIKADAHCQDYFEGFCSVNENGQIIPRLQGLPVADKKIVINHYYTKSVEEYHEKLSRGAADGFTNYAGIGKLRFDVYNSSAEFDDSILRYRAQRTKTYQMPDKSHVDERLFNALTKNLSPTLLPTTTPDFYRGKMETFLTCRAVAAYLQKKLTDETPAKFFEEAALKAVIKSFGGMSVADAQLFILELPEILSLPYPAVKDIRQAAINIIPQMTNYMRLNKKWKFCVELDYLQRLLKTWH